MQYSAFRTPLCCSHWRSRDAQLDQTISGEEFTGQMHEDSLPAETLLNTFDNFCSLSCSDNKGSA